MGYKIMFTSEKENLSEFFKFSDKNSTEIPNISIVDINNTENNIQKGGRRRKMNTSTDQWNDFINNKSKIDSISNPTSTITLENKLINLFEEAEQNNQDGGMYHMPSAKKPRKNKKSKKQARGKSKSKGKTTKSKGKKTKSKSKGKQTGGAKKKSKSKGKTKKSKSKGKTTKSKSKGKKTKSKSKGKLARGKSKGKKTKSKSKGKTKSKEKNKSKSKKNYGS